MTEQQAQTQWHQLFGAVLEELLTPIGVTVQTEVDVSSKPPRIDILLLQRQQAAAWTEEQRRRLPDGARDSQASHILLEFKYSESVNGEAIRQALGYDVFYRRAKTAKDLPDREIQSFIVSAKTPQPDTLAKFAYHRTELAGVYRSSNVLLTEIPLLILNELGDKPHNVFFKLFASRVQAKTKALSGLKQWWLKSLPGRLYWLIRGLLEIWFKKGEQVMEAITPELLIERGKLLKETLLPTLAREEMRELWWDTPEAQEISEEIRQEGRQEGQEAMAEAVARILAIRFGVEMAHFAPTLAPLSLSSLKMLSEIALTVDSLSDFEVKLDELIKPS